MAENLMPFDELNNMRARLQDMRDIQLEMGLIPKFEKREVEDMILDLLIMAYVFGGDSVSTMLSIEYPSEYDTDEMMEVIYKKVAGKDFAERVAEYAPTANVDDIMRVAETDAHRVYETSAYKAAKAAGATQKRWNVLGINTRETHWYVDQTTVPIDSEFVTFDGDSARFPGDFSKAQNNVNCNCWLTYEW